jgi:pyrimidine operon attenuation protein/uracil phosphoribosyltransferase
MSAEDVRRAIARIAHEIAERNQGANDLALVGILRRGAPIADRLAGLIESIEGIRPLTGSLDIALYRDDFPRRQPEVSPSDISFDVTSRRIVLVDEVFYTGRTVRAAIEALMDLGRPSEIQLAVLIDRGHRELPIRPDYVGKELATSRSEHVLVHLTEIDGEDSVSLSESE